MELIKLIKKYGLRIFLISLSLGLIVFFGSYLKAPKYLVISKVMVSQKTIEDSKVPSPLVMQSTKYTAEVLAEITATRAFLEETLRRGGLGYILERGDGRYLEKYFEKNIGKKIKARVIKDTDIIEIEVFDENAETAKKLSEVVIQILKEKTEELNNTTNAVELKIIDPPVFPGSKLSPRPFFNFVVTFTAFLILGIIMVLLL